MLNFCSKPTEFIQIIVQFQFKFPKLGEIFESVYSLVFTMLGAESERNAEKLKIILRPTNPSS